MNGLIKWFALGSDASASGDSSIQRMSEIVAGDCFSGRFSATVFHTAAGLARGFTTMTRKRVLALRGMTADVETSMASNFDINVLRDDGQREGNTLLSSLDETPN